MVRSKSIFMRQAFMLIAGGHDQAGRKPLSFCPVSWQIIRRLFFDLPDAADIRLDAHGPVLVVDHISGHSMRRFL